MIDPRHQLLVIFLVVKMNSSLWVVHWTIGWLSPTIRMAAVRLCRLPVGLPEVLCWVPFRIRWALGVISWWAGGSAIVVRVMSGWAWSALVMLRTLWSVGILVTIVGSLRTWRSEARVWIVRRCWWRKTSVWTGWSLWTEWSEWLVPLIIEMSVLWSGLVFMSVRRCWMLTRAGRSMEAGFGLQFPEVEFHLI